MIFCSALEQSREAFAISGSIDNPLSRGCHQLIKMGAKLVEKAEDIIEELAPLIVAAKMTTQVANKQEIKNDNGAIDHSLLPKVQQKILKNVAYTPISIDTLVNRSGLTAAEINANLVLLEVEDYIQSHPGGLVSLNTLVK